MKRGQDTLGGFHIGDKVGYVSRTAGYVVEIVEIEEDNFKEGFSWVTIALPNGATTLVKDIDLAKIPPNDTAHH